MKINQVSGKVVRVLCGALLLALSTNAIAAPQSGKSAAGHAFGAGIVLGEPTGLSAKLWLDQYKAMDFGLAFSLDSYFLIFSDYLFHFRGAFGGGHAFLNQLTPYLGIGGLLAFSNHRFDGKNRHFYGTRDSSVGVGIRIPLGIEWMAPTPRLGVFLEIVPGLALLPGTSGFVDAGIGVRYYF